jgi:hypothetical protein
MKLLIALVIILAIILNMWFEPTKFKKVCLKTNKEITFKKCVILDKKLVVIEKETNWKQNILDSDEILTLRR